MRRHKKDETKITIEFIYKNSDERIKKAIKDFFEVLQSEEECSYITFGSEKDKRKEKQ